MNLTKQELPIAKTPITHHSYYAIPLSIIMAQDRFKCWYYQYFIQLYAARHCKEIGEIQQIYYCDNDVLFDEVLERNIPEMLPDPGSLIEYLITLIHNKTFIEIYLDCFYIYEAEEHHFFNALVYGYDLEEHAIMVLAYNDFLFKPMRISFEKLIASYTFSRKEENRTNREKFVLRTLKLKDINPEFIPLRFIKDIEKFLKSDGTNQIIELRPWDDYVKSYGINVFYDLTDYIDDVIGSIGSEVRLYYHDIHIFSEHKRLLLERLSYVNTLVDISECIERYIPISEQAEHVRLKYIKYQLEKGVNIYTQISDIEFLRNLQKEVYKITSLEEKILTSILGLLYQRL